MEEGDGVEAGAELFGKLAFQHLRDTASELDDLEAADQLALGVGEHLAMLGGDHRRQPVEIALDEVAEAEERAGADMRRCRRPARKGVERGLHRHVDLTRAAKSELRADLPCGGVIRSEEHTSELQSLMRISY